MDKLSSEQKKLLEMDFGDLEKIAEEKVAAVSDCYAYGFSKLATEMANGFDKFAAEDKEEDKEEDKGEDKEDKGEDKEDKMDEESEKEAAERGAFIERGFFDGLRKLGSERHDNEMHYLLPMIQEKVAAGMMSNALNAVKDYTRRAGSQVASGAKQIATAAKGQAGMKGMPGIPLSGGQRKALATEGLKNLGAGAGKLAPHAAAAGVGIYGASKALGGGKKE